MPRVRSEFKGKFPMDKHEFYTAYHYALQYPKWRDQYNALADTSKGITYDKDKVQTSITGSSIEDVAIKMANLRSKMDLVEQTAEEVNKCFAKYLIKAVTREGVTFNYLNSICLMPCNKNAYYDMRREFYYRLFKKICEK